MLTLTFLGVGSAFAKRNFQSNALVEVWSSDPQQQSAPDDTLLIDFGATGPLALHALKERPGFEYLNQGGRIAYSAIRNVFITHLHGDHVGGLEELAVVTRYASRLKSGGRRSRPRLIADESILATLWEQCLRGGLGVHSEGVATLEDYFEVIALHAPPVAGPASFTLLERYELLPIRTDHIRIQRRYDWPSFGLLLRDRQTNETVVYSGDTRFDPDGLGPLLRDAKTIFHEVHLEEPPDPVHTMLNELRTLPESTRKKTFLYHFSDCWDDPRFACVAEEFAGFARPQIRMELFP